MKFIEHRVADRRVLRLIQKWLKAGVSEDGPVVGDKAGHTAGSSYHSPYAKGNFEFERVVTGWRGIHSVIDLRRKR
jgi:hypothetical protein